MMNDNEMDSSRSDRGVFVLRISPCTRVVTEADEDTAEALEWYPGSG